MPASNVRCVIIAYAACAPILPVYRSSSVFHTVLFSQPLPSSTDVVNRINTAGQIIRDMVTRVQNLESRLSDYQVRTQAPRANKMNGRMDYLIGCSCHGRLLWTP
jgi:hypothetical protein